MLKEKTMDLLAKPQRLKILTTITAITFFLAVMGMIVFTVWPGVGAAVAHPLRQVIGNERVAQLETILFTVQDNVQQWKYDLGLEEPEAPWQVAAVAPPSQPTRPTLTPSPTVEVVKPAETPFPSVTPTVTPTSTPGPTATPTPAPWTLPAVSPFTELEGEGIWQPYLYNEAGDVVGLRTFLLPDPERPYTTVAVVAFDLQKTTLHYVLGIDEPTLPDGPSGNGTILSEHKQTRHLLAAFNGGFMATHG
jgi:hypothetical protein